MWDQKEQDKKLCRGSEVDTNTESSSTSRVVQVVGEDVGNLEIGIRHFTVFTQTSGCTGKSAGQGVYHPKNGTYSFGMVMLGKIVQVLGRVEVLLVYL